MNFNSVLIGSDDPGRLSAYYTKLFGAPTWDGDGYAGWMIGDGAITVGPHSEVRGKNVQPGRILLNIESQDVKADFERLAAAGANVVREPYEFEGSPGTWIATLADPDDNYFQLMSPMTPPEG
jgi:predicted enzyme related to lactoylglutathione lyase